MPNEFLLITQTFLVQICPVQLWSLIVMDQKMYHFHMTENNGQGRQKLEIWDGPSLLIGRFTHHHNLVMPHNTVLIKKLSQFVCLLKHNLCHCLFVRSSRAKHCDSVSMYKTEPGNTFAWITIQVSGQSVQWVSFLKLEIESVCLFYNCPLMLLSDPSGTDRLLSTG